MLINLTNNAVKFTQEGEVILKVSLEERLPYRAKIRFSIRDSGIGMTPEQTARLFQAFSQADTSTTRKHGGTGLGLSISRRLVEMMGGNIWVESELGRGSTFSFSAWFGIGSAVMDQKKLAPDLTGIRALVVDDNTQAREIFREMLKQCALRVECVSSGVDALQELSRADSSDPYRLVLMDWHMTGMSGLEASRVIKHGGHLRNVPKIVMVSTFSRADLPASAEGIGIESYLQKPISPSQLYDALMNLFGLTQQGMPTRSAAKTKAHKVDAQGLRILLVEDNEVNQQVAREILESAGASVTIASHGAEAVEILTGGERLASFDAVLMDLQMPEMDGFTATKLLRAKPEFRELPIIAMSADAMTEAVQRCLEAGMNDHIGKPFVPDALFATLERWTHGRVRSPSDLPAKPRGAGQEAILPEIEGLDMTAALQRVAGNKRLYRDLLTQFVAKHESTGNRIKEALESGDRNQVERLAHSLKGVAGNLGINRIFVLAGNLEKAISESHERAVGVTQELTSAMDRQIRTIRAAFLVAGNEENRLDARPAGHAEVVAALAQLRELLETSDAAAPRAFMTVAELLEGSVARERLTALGAAVNDFDFDSALFQLNQVADQLRTDEG